MVDGESHEVAAGPGGAPANRDRRPSETVIEGERPPKDAEAPAPEAPSGRAGPPLSSPSAQAALPSRALAAGAAAGAIVSALAAGLLYLFQPKAGPSEAEVNRLAGLETALSRENAAIAALDKRVGGLETSAAQSGIGALDKRLGALEAASAAGGRQSASDAEATQAISGDVKSLRADLDAARREIPALAARVAKLETAAPPGDLSAVAGRVDKLETALAGQKAETRAAPEAAPPPRDNPAAVAIVAQTVRDKLDTGAAFQSELDALGALGVDPQKLQPLKAMAAGAPTDRALAASFQAVEAKALAAVPPPESDGITERFLAHLRGLVEISRVGETAGDDPQALASQIVARLERGDLAGALARFARLPEAARSAASAWEVEVEAKEAALAAAQSIRGTAVTRMVQTAKPR